MPKEVWSDSSHESIRAFPAPHPKLRVFLESDGLHRDAVLAKLPFDRNRSNDGNATIPDPKRYRDPRLVYVELGLVYENPDRTLSVTGFGHCLLRFFPYLNRHNRRLLAQHASLALACCQLRNPTNPGKEYGADMEAFPFAFIWHAMLRLDGRLSSDEMRRGIMATRTWQELDDCVARVLTARAANDVGLIGEPATQQSDDRIIKWMSQASLGWLLFSEKRGGFYELYDDTIPAISNALRLPRKHLEFPSVADYAAYISHSACLPKNLQ